ncbi:uncharacterized protein [Solanum lycopersicum]|uniref:uncharacterized protein n=1 Tax=Solanum lycopersicum TaxID=4081 RepID=UPI00374816FF
MKGVVRLGKRGKSSPDYVGPYEILQKIGKVAYELKLASVLASVHPVFHASMLKNCVGDPKSILPVEGLAVKDDRCCDYVPVKILDRQVKMLRNKEMVFVKVL